MRFSLHRFLAVSIVSSAAIGFVGLKVRDWTTFEGVERNVVPLARKGAIVYFNEVNGSVYRVEFERPESEKFVDNDVSELLKLEDLRHIDFRGTNITPLALSKLKEMQTLESLVLPRSKVSQSDVADLHRSLPDCIITLE